MVHQYHQNLTNSPTCCVSSVLWLLIIIPTNSNISVHRNGNTLYHTYLNNSNTFQTSLAHQNSTNSIHDSHELQKKVCNAMGCTVSYTSRQLTNILRIMNSLNFHEVYTLFPQTPKQVYMIQCTSVRWSKGWLPLVGSFKLWVSFAEYSFFYMALLQKRLVILRSLRIVATP